MDKEAVVSWFNEDLDWLSIVEKIGWRITVYKKGTIDQTVRYPKQWQFINLQNVGQEAHTFLSHIVNRYDTMADQTLFMQGRVKDHVPGFTQKLREAPERIGFYPFGSHLQKGKIGAWGSYDGHGSLAYKSFFGVDPPDEETSFLPHALFIVSNDLVRYRPLEMYQRALAWIEVDHSHGGFCEDGTPGTKAAVSFEGLWQIIFNGRDR